ncbi:hypothetical protein D3C78_1432630 [compost metagenome]
MNSIGLGNFLITSVCIQNWYNKLIAIMVAIIVGVKPTKGIQSQNNHEPDKLPVHVCLNAVPRLYF